MPSKSPTKPSKVKTTPDFSREESGIICGVDEAGRGPLAGPVTAACVFVPHENRGDEIWKRVNDSKAISLKQREDYFTTIKEHAYFGIACATVEEIDSLNILQATILAMKRATENMCATFSLNPDLVLIDGNYKPQFPYPVKTVVKGDSVSISIAAASILAKVTRDHLMNELHLEFPHYGWSKNAGYGTAQHMKALREHGPCPHHRDFAPIKALRAA